MIWDELETGLAQLTTEGLLRRRRTLDAPCGPEAVVDGRRFIAFCSNDYLGLANHPALITAVQEAAARWGVGSGASHVVSGHLRPHAELEERLAAFVGREQALYFTTGYMANLAIAPALLERHDAIFADRLNHASLIDAAQLARAEHIRYPHGDLDALADRLQRSRARRKLILTDAVFSMDGDLAPLPELFALAERFDAWLVVDDAHGFGVLGPKGRGSLAHFQLPASPRLILMGTLGKAAGVSGAFIAGDRRVIEWLMQRGRPYIFTTASSPVIAAALLVSLELIAAGDDRRAHLQALIARLRVGLRNLPWRLLPSPTAIQPLVIGDNSTTLALAEQLLAKSLWIPAIRPPTVPTGTARLRISLSAAHTVEQVDALLTALSDCIALNTPVTLANPLPFEKGRAGGILPAKQRIRQAFDQAAATYDEAADVQREVCDRLAGYFEQSSADFQPKTILEAGCGTGYSVRWLQQCWPHAELTLVDFAHSMLIASCLHYPGAMQVCADIEALPFARRQFDLYWSSLAWQWNDPRQCLIEAGRVLRPGGMLAVATLGTDNFPELRHAFATMDDYSHVLTIPAPERLLAHCQAGGWAVNVWQRQAVRRHYPDLRALLRRVKAVGAREVEQRRPTPFGRAAWQAVTARYEQLREPEGLPLTYDVVWLIAHRLTVRPPHSLAGAGLGERGNSDETSIFCGGHGHRRWQNPGDLRPAACNSPNGFHDSGHEAYRGWG